MGLNDREKLGAEALASAVRLGGRDVLRTLPQVQSALSSFVRLGNFEGRVEVTIGRNHVLRVRKQNQRQQRLKERYEIEDRCRDILITFLEEVLRG